ncbi:hypothetical protein [Deinococcus alpinitundrae]|uniref:hypothetical protein n=1 Tax=Deinococcus alpinitundrae TaxID=468913 RepID=UPI001379F930|nr:hypothetical protein [Deinococcus alpinitundrae]
MKTQDDSRRLVGQAGGVVAITALREDLTAPERFATPHIDLFNLGPGLAVLHRLRLLWSVGQKDLAIGWPTYQLLHPGKELLLMNTERLLLMAKNAYERGLDCEGLLTVQHERRLLVDLATAQGPQTLEIAFLVHQVSPRPVQVEFLFAPGAPELP